MKFWNLFRAAPPPPREVPSAAPPTSAIDDICAELGEGTTWVRKTQETGPDRVGIVITCPNGDSFASWGLTTAEAVEKARVRAAVWKEIR